MPKGQGQTWLAGLLEGEGCFTWSRNHKCKIPRITVSMTDHDVVARVAEEMAGKVNGPYSHGHKPVFMVVIQGVKALAKMLEVFPEMGQRRRERINFVLSEWEHGNA